MKKVSLLPYVEILWLEDVKAVQVKWLQLHLSLEEFKEVTTAVVEMIRMHESSIWIVDQYNSQGVFSKKIIDFIANELVEDIGVKLILTVVPKEKGLSSLNTKRWMGDVRKVGEFTMVDFAT
ncbi:MAG: Unknown protein, partial [uncultured Aureispira sp.]